MALAAALVSVAAAVAAEVVDRFARFGAGRERLALLLLAAPELVLAAVLLCLACVADLLSLDAASLVSVSITAGGMVAPASAALIFAKKKIASQRAAAAP